MDIWSPPHLATQISTFLCGSGILLFREASTILVTYGTRILQRTQSGRPKRDDCSDPLPSSAIGSKISPCHETCLSWIFLGMFPLGRYCASLPCESQMGEALGAKVSWRLCGEVQRYWGLWGYQSVCQVCSFDSCFLKFFLIQYQPQKTWLECWSSQKIQPINHEHFCHLFSPDHQNWGLDMFSHALHGLLGQKGPVNVGDWPSLEQAPFELCFLKAGLGSTTKELYQLWGLRALQRQSLKEVSFHLSATTSSGILFDGGS